MKACILLVTLSFLSLTSLAMEPFERHVLSICQGMSAYYMYLLTQGDEKYLNEFKIHHSAARSSLAKMKADEYSNISQRWLKFTTKIQSRSSANHEIYLDRVVRYEYRKYLTDLYLQFEKNRHKKLSGSSRALVSMQILINLLAARSLDLVSSDYGSLGMFEHDNLLNPKIIAQKIQQNLAVLLNRDAADNQENIFRKINAKFNFLKSTLVNNYTQTPYFMIYTNVKHINKLLTKNVTSQFVSQ